MCLTHDQKSATLLSRGLHLLGAVEPASKYRIIYHSSATRRVERKNVLNKRTPNKSLALFLFSV
jgi:hypothetical protein